ncbi:MAG: DUF177 domain-containing protein [Angelakisella sp.]|jgi:uncharacterized protein|nr:DUF177 domain-containing protein [Angelakisella sp.]MCI9529357.1 DUF177 domain-containing protein [Angelakisella sp.]
MRFDLNRLLDGAGVSEVVTDDVDLSRYSAGGEAPFQTPVQLTAQARNRAGVVTLDCVYRYTLALRCDRCLAPVSREITLTVPHTVVRSLQNTEEDDEYLVAPDGLVELSEVAANDVIPELPSRTLCREDCKGLCPSCGCDRNTTQCRCEEKETDPRLAALDKFFDEGE